MKSRVTFVLLSLAVIAVAAAGQQANGPLATLTIDGFDGGVHPIGVTLVAPDPATLNVRGTPSSPFTLFAGPVDAGHLALGPVGIVDLDLQQTFAVLDGIHPRAPLDLLAVLDASGAFDQTFVPPAGVTGPLTGLQAAVADPTLPEGVRLTAANDLHVVPGFTLSSITPANGTYLGGEQVTVTGSGFTVGAPAVVFFGPFQAPQALATGTGTLAVTTPAGPPGSTQPVHVTQNGVTRTLLPGFTYATLPDAEVLVNEVFTGNVDFVELYNPSPYPIDLAGWSLHSWYHGTTQDAGGPYVFPSDTFLQPGGFLVVQEYGTPHQPGSLVPQSISTGYNFWWTGGRQVEVALVNHLGIGVDYVHRRWQGSGQAPNLPWNLAWTGAITANDDVLARSAFSDTDDASDFALGSSPTPGVPNPGQGVQ